MVSLGTKSSGYCPWKKQRNREEHGGKKEVNIRVIQPQIKQSQEPQMLEVRKSRHLINFLEKVRPYQY
jgi:hypothetical protein